MVGVFFGQGVGFGKCCRRGCVGQVVLCFDGLPQLVGGALAELFEAGQVDETEAVDEFAEVVVERVVFVRGDDSVFGDLAEGFPVGRVLQVAARELPVDAEAGVAAGVAIEGLEGERGVADGLFQGRQFIGRGWVVGGCWGFGEEVGAFRFGDVVDEGGVAEEEHSVAVHLWIVEDAVDDFEFGDALAGVVLDPAVFAGGLFGERGGDPVVALAEDSDEEGSAFVDLLEAEVEDLVFLGFLFGDSPAEVDVDEVDAVLLEPFA